MAITTAMADSFKVELLQGAHCFNGPVYLTASAASNAIGFTALANVTGLACGMYVTGAGVPANAQIGAITAGTTLNISAPTTAILSATPVTFTGDIFKMALIRATAATTFSNLSTNYSQMTAADELTNGSGYATGGMALVNSTPIPGGTSPGVQALVSFSVNPSWTSATFSTIGCMIHNTSNRLQNLTGRCAGVFDFGGTQTVTNGTFTVVMPNFSSASAILRIA